MRNESKTQALSDSPAEPALLYTALPTKRTPPRLPADLQDFLSEGRLDQLHGKLGRGVALIEDGIDLDHFERGHDAGVSNELHDGMCFPIIQAALYRGPYPWRHRRIHRIEVETYMHEVGAGGHLGQRLFHDLMHSMPIDIRHGVDLHAGFFQSLLLSGI